ILVAARPRGLAFNSDGSLAYSSSEVGNEVTIIDTKTLSIIKQAEIDLPNSKPMDIAVSPDDKTIYVTTGRGNSVAVLDAKTLEMQANIPVGKRVWGLGMTRDGSRLYTADGVSGT
ncbi:beta-propeller fold lactonase family protein, partial [Methylophaga sp. UBA5088]